MFCNCFSPDLMPFFVLALIIFAGVVCRIVLGARLPFLFHLGCLGLRDSVSTNVPAYLSSCNDVRSFFGSLLDLSSVVFHGESSLHSSVLRGSDFQLPQIIIVHYTINRK